MVLTSTLWLSMTCFQSAWDAVKKKFTDEKLEKLDVEKSTGSSMLHIHASVSYLCVFSIPFHSLSAQISSPADPALLFFKLSKLQQAQNSQSRSASVSPEPMFTLSPPPPAIIQPVPSVTANPAPLRHWHFPSMVAAPLIPMHPDTTFNNNSIPFKFGKSLAPDASRSPDARSNPGLLTDQSLAPPAMPARADSPPDFIRGFGLDALDEEQEPEEQAVTEEEPMLVQVSHIAVPDADDTIDMELEEEDAFQENGSSSRNGYSDSGNASIAGEDEDEGEVQQTLVRHAVRSRGSSGEIIEHASRPSLDDLHCPTIEERLEALLERKLDGFREEVRALRAESLSTSQALHDKTSELLVLYHDVLSRLIGVPGSMGGSIEAAKLADVELLTHTITEEQSMIATNSGLQAKVRAQYDSVRAEKDIMVERISSERDQLSAKVDEIQEILPLRATDAATSRTMELGEMPSQSLSQFQKSDVTIESQQERLLEPENLNRELEAGEQALVSKASYVSSCSCVS